jgi:hypothetical protein
MKELMTSRLAERYRAALFALRRDIVRHSSHDTAELLLGRVQDLADELMRNTQPLVQVPLSVAQRELEDERAREGAPLGDFVSLELPSDTDVSGLLSDSEPIHSGLRDMRHPEHAA